MTLCPVIRKGEEASRTSVIHKRERPRDSFERLALGRDAPDRHATTAAAIISADAEQVAGEDAVARAGIDQGAEQPGPATPPMPGADRVEQRDGERADLQRKRLADGEIGRARRGEAKKKITIQAKVWLARGQSAAARTDSRVSASSSPEIA